jgi:CheY-like chemotaxis protein
VVDDNVDAAESLVTLLRLWGHEVAVAYDGPSALDLAAEFRPEVILLDIGMPDMDGYEVARRLRAQAAFATTQIMALTGWGAEEDRVRSRAAGFTEHLTKPANPQVLEDLLRGPPPP